MNLRDEVFFPEVKRDILHEIRKAKNAPKIYETWEIGDGHIYPTELHAKIAIQVHKKGYLHINTITGDRLLADRLEELIELGILKQEGQDEEHVYLSVQEPPKGKDKRIIDDDKEIDTVENLYSRYIKSSKPIKAIRKFFNTSNPK